MADEEIKKDKKEESEEVPAWAEMLNKKMESLLNKLTEDKTEDEDEIQKVQVPPPPAPQIEEEPPLIEEVEEQEQEKPQKKSFLSWLM